MHDNALTPLTVKQCTPDFISQLSTPSAEEDNWLSIFPIVSQLVQHFMLLPQPLLIFNARFWQAAVAVITESTDNNHKQLALQNYDQQRLFGRLSLLKEPEIDFLQGEIYNFNHGSLILHISPLLVNPNLWFLLKAFLIDRKLPATSAVNGDKLKGQYPLAPSQEITTKIILVANRYQLDELAQIDPEYNLVGSLFTELSSDIKSTDKNIHALHNYCLKLIAKRNLMPISTQALALLFHHLSSQCEHQKKILFAPELIENLLRYGQLFNTEESLLSADSLQKALDIQVQSQSLVENFSDQALLEKQLKIQLKGQEIGQINGMSVVELMGYPTEFGEIFRISASDMLGDGEIVDVERKVELAGNIHAKSILIVQGYLNHFFTHIQHFPLSCNVVFEQSYQESDGDSASLAIFLAVTSCYAQTPISQNLFVTGSLDQHGNVLAIGGVNQKIKAVTRLFLLGLLSEPVTILIPKANQINLTLEVETLKLISRKKINIYGIDHCQEAFPLSMKLAFNEIVIRIHKRIEELNKEDEQENSVLNRCLALFR
ncbi:S16 family serine protease [Psychromonas antarctica]|jgi:Lon-like ATP-dependent protease|uniref:S16 family serine protease n=1 Tax=Psychromonas antarctica TaxID=67573 RepID=UPI001EE8B8BE|nr:S16 family serine protease [Psychromonas antarctica]MCG6200593.1 AAA family ATPase [Psychromonas antarctica]